MRYARYRKLERQIADSDNGGIIARWRYGRRLLEDGEAMTGGGSLKRGILRALVEDARKDGRALSEREVQYRLQAARTYPSEAEVRSAAADFGAWRNLCDAGFPSVQVPLDSETGPFDPRDEDEKRRDAARELARRGEEGAGQLSLFPDDKYGEFSTLTELAKYAAEMAEMTERYARRDRERDDYLTALIDAVNGDMSKTWGDAQAALDTAEGGAE